MNRNAGAMLVTLGLVAGCGSTGGVILDVHQQWQQRRAGLRQHKVRVENVQVSYAEGGEGEPIVMLHGFSGDKSNWFAFAQHFTDDFRVIAPDLPPFGDSAEPPEPACTVDGHVSRLHGCAQALGLKRFHLVGNSMGGHTAALYASRHPEQVMTLALLDAAGVEMPVPSDGWRLLEEGTNGFVIRSPQDTDRLFDMVFVDEPWMPPPVRAHFTQREMARASRIERWFGEYRQHWVPLEPLLPTIQQPTLVLWGDADRVVHPSAAKVFGARLPNARMVMMKGCGHVPMLERPDEAAGHYLRFLIGHPTRQP